MKRHFALVAVLVLLLLPFLNPFPYSMPLAIVYESNEKPFFAAADGDESSESITSFSETLDDDVLFYPDTFDANVIDFADSGDSKDPPLGSGGGSSGDHTDTFVKDGVAMYDVTTADDCEIWVNWTVPTGDYVIDGFNYALYYKGRVATVNVHIWDYTAGDWGASVANTGDNTYAWANGTIYDPDYWGSQVSIKVHGTHTPSISQAFIDYAEVTWYYLTLADSAYAESFCSVSDWSAESGFAGTITTDGDVANITETTDTYCRMTHTFGSAQDFDGHYLEYRTTATTAESYRVSLYGGTNWFYVEGYGTNLGTKKGYISDATGDSGFDASAVTKIVLAITGDGGTLGIDYLRIGPADEMGWQHDGSTTAGTDDDGNAAWTYGASSDGDILTITQTRTGSGNSWSNFKILFDTTTTSADLEQDYYPFFAIRWRCTTLTTENVYVIIYSDGEKYDGLFSTTSIFGWTTSYYNLKADSGSADSNKYIRVASKGDAVDEQSVVEIDWTKMFSIANNTLTQSGTGADDYLYVDSGVLYSHIDDGHIVLDRDPALSVAQASYPVYNLTTSGTAPEFSQYVSSWSTYSDDTRGAVSSGTVTDIRLNFDSTEVLSAIKFIEDGTAPDVIDKFVNPVDPYDDESVTFTAVTYDAIEVYEVTLNAVVYPVGFNDVDYDLTEQTDDVLWSYEFSTLTAGYYLFQVTASDGANTYSEYIPVTVRESEITVDAISFFGVGEDFSTMTFSFDINKACSYVINEASENVGASDTHSGSVSEGMQNIAWTKLTTDDALVNFTITFTNASLTYAIEGQYQVAQVALAVSSYDWGFSETQVTISFQTSKGGTYTVYLDDVQDSTDSFVTGSNFLNWTRTSAEDPAEIQAAVLLTDGTTTIWLNQTYSEYGLTAETALIINTLIFDRSEANITAFVTSNWLNCTTTLYENEVQKDTGSEGTTLTYLKSTSAGTYNVALKIDGGGSVLWYNLTYTIAADAITIDTYTFFGTSSDFSYMQYSGQISHDCTYNISEWSSSWAKNETHTGSVTAGLFNIAWDKIGVNDVDANFTIVFVNGSLSLTIEGYYGTAYKLLRITEIDVHNLEESRSLTNLTVNFHTNKDIDWCVYDVDDNDAVLASGSSLEGSGNLTWVKNRIPHAHFYAVKWTDGVSNVWYNNSYWTYRENMDSLDQPGKDWEAADARKTIEFWTTVTALIVIGAIIAIGISHYNLSSKIKALQIPHYETQERNRK